jgi:hypothetical protein
MAAAEAARDDARVFREGAKRGEETVLSDAKRDFVVLLFVSERSGHSAAPRIDLLNAKTLDAREDPLERRGSVQGLLMAVAVERDPRRVGDEPDIEPPFADLAIEKDLEREDPLGRAPREILVVHEVGEVVGEGGRASGLADDNRYSFANEAIEVAECSLAVPLGFAEKAVREAGSLAAAGPRENDFVAARFEKIERRDADLGLMETHVGVVEKDDLAPAAALASSGKRSVERAVRVLGKKASSIEAGGPLE